MLGHQNKDKTDDGSRRSPLMLLIQKIRPKRRHHSGGPDSQKRQRNVEDGERDSGMSSVGLDMTVEAEVQEMTMTRQTMAPPSAPAIDDDVKPPGNGEIVSFVSEQSREGDSMLRVTSEQVVGTGLEGEQVFKVDCKGLYDDPRTQFQWIKHQPKVEGHENCLGVYLNMKDPNSKSSTSSPDEQYPFRLSCHKMTDGKIHLVARKVPRDHEDTEGLLYVCHRTDKGGVITLQENASKSSQPLAGHFIGTTSDGQLRMFQKNVYEAYTSNPFSFFHIMDLVKVKTESTKRMNGET